MFTNKKDSVRPVLTKGQHLCSVRANCVVEATLYIKTSRITYHGRDYHPGFEDEKSSSRETEQFPAGYAAIM